MLTFLLVPHMPSRLGNTRREALLTSSTTNWCYPCWKIDAIKTVSYYELGKWSSNAWLTLFCEDLPRRLSWSLFQQRWTLCSSHEPRSDRSRTFARRLLLWNLERVQEVQSVAFPLEPYVPFGRVLYLSFLIHSASADADSMVGFCLLKGGDCGRTDWVYFSTFCRNLLFSFLLCDCSRTISSY